MDNTLLATALVVTLLFIALSTYFLFLHRRTSSGPVIYLVGHSGSGKTALWSYVMRVPQACLQQFQYGRVVPTQTSMSIISATLSHASLEKQIVMIDCPGHPRLAHLLRQSLSTYSPRGIIILID